MIQEGSVDVIGRDNDGLPFSVRACPPARGWAGSPAGEAETTARSEGETRTQPAERRPPDGPEAKGGAQADERHAALGHLARRCMSRLVLGQPRELACRGGLMARLAEAIVRVGRERPIPAWNTSASIGG